MFFFNGKLIGIFIFLKILDGLFKFGLLNNELCDYILDCVVWFVDRLFWINILFILFWVGSWLLFGVKEFVKGCWLLGKEGNEGCVFVGLLFIGVLSWFCFEVIDN